MGSAFLAAGSTAAFGQAASAPADAKICDVINHPRDFDGKMVRLTGTVQADFDTFLLRGDTCSSALWLSYPAGTKAKSGPATIITLQLASNAAGTTGKARPALTLERSKDFDTFDNLLSQRPKTPGMCLACPKNDVTATLVGRVDGTENAGLTRDSSGKITSLDGFGNMNAYPVRLVITSVSNVAAKEIDYTKAPKVDGDNQGGNGKDANALARKTEEAFPKGSDAPQAIEAAVAAFGAPGVDNGVTVGFGNVANVPDGEGSKSGKASADGLILNVLFDSDRLKGDTMARAIGHQGTAINLLRGKDTPGMMQIEAKSWGTTLYETIGARQKSLTLPGGYVLWDDRWPAADKTSKANDALTSFLSDREQTPR